MKKAIAYFLELLATLKSIDSRLAALEKCLGKEYDGNGNRCDRVFRTGGRYD